MPPQPASAALTEKPPLSWLIENVVGLGLLAAMVACLFLMLPIVVSPAMSIVYGVAVFLTALLSAMYQRLMALKNRYALRQRLALEQLANQPVAAVEQRQADQPVPPLRYFIQRSLWIALIAGPGLAVVTSVGMHLLADSMLEFSRSEASVVQSFRWVWSLAVPTLFFGWLMIAQMLFRLGERLADAQLRNRWADQLPPASETLEPFQPRLPLVVRFFTLGGGLVAYTCVLLLIIAITALLPVSTAARNGASILLLLSYLGVVLYLYTRGPLSPRHQLQQIEEEFAEEELDPVQQSQLERADRTFKQREQTLEYHIHKRGEVLAIGMVLIIVAVSIGLSRFAYTQGADDSITAVLLIGGLMTHLRLPVRRAV